MEAQGIVVPPGGGAVWNMAPGRSAALKLLNGETSESVMMFEETAPAGTETTFHLHHDSDEIAYVLAGEVTIKIGDRVSVGGPGTCAFMAARRSACLESHRSPNRAHTFSLHTRRGGRVLRRVAAGAALVWEDGAA